MEPGLQFLPWEKSVVVVVSDRKHWTGQVTLRSSDTVVRTGIMTLLRSPSTDDDIAKAPQ